MLARYEQSVANISLTVATSRIFSQIRYLSDPSLISDGHDKPFSEAFLSGTVCRSLIATDALPCTLTLTLTHAHTRAHGLVRRPLTAFQDVQMC